MRQLLTDDDGSPVISYLEGTRDGLPWAHQIEVEGPRAVPIMMARLHGWRVSVPEPLGRELRERGARLVRHAHVMSHDLTGLSAPPPPRPACGSCRASAPPRRSSARGWPPTRPATPTIRCATPPTCCATSWSRCSAAR
ncbi:hypothetical protein OIE66_40335 [Nonomuraea sp. NBC_01738]|uniref:hypothetical protein n=1 Tax=Nonomuraea sp. NBC_01738 TaxID=2976003 RepID=UPI002E151901|nr:hypothetical protein OIE66_40335 [Nonomuraea sp. NBC_01738]